MNKLAALQEFVCCSDLTVQIYYTFVTVLPGTSHTMLDRPFPCMPDDVIHQGGFEHRQPASQTTGYRESCTDPKQNLASTS